MMDVRFICPLERCCFKTGVTLTRGLSILVGSASTRTRYVLRGVCGIDDDSIIRLVILDQVRIVVARPSPFQLE